MDPGQPPSRLFPRQADLGRIGSSSSTDSASSPAPMSSLLQDRLRERKAENHRVNKPLETEAGKQSSQANGFDARETQSSPAVPPHKELHRPTRKSTGASSRSVSAPKDMCMREMEEYVSNMKKQNFDLKLELFHRRQRCDVLEAQMEAKNAQVEELKEQLKQVDRLEEEHMEAVKINEDLLKELEQRDMALQEAVEMICGLEDVAAHLRLHVDNCPRRDGTGEEEEASERAPRAIVGVIPSPPPLARPPNLRSLGSESGLQDNVRVQSPSRLQRTLSAQDTTHQVQPFLELHQHGDLDSNSVVSSQNLRPISGLSGRYDGVQTPEGNNLRSPSLSVLSESSFMSIYGQGADPDASELFDSLADEEFADSASVEKHGTDAMGNARQGHDSRSVARPLPSKPQVESIGQILHTHTRPESLSWSLRDRERRVLDRISRNIERASSKTDIGTVPEATATYGQPRLPPTPDTLPTMHPTATNSLQSIVTERSVGDLTGQGAKTHRVPPATADQSKFHGYHYQDLAEEEMRCNEDEDKYGTASLGERRHSFESLEGALSALTQGGMHHEDSARNFMHATTKVMKSMGIAPPSETPYYGSNIMFDGEDTMSGSFGNVTMRDRERSRRDTARAASSIPSKPSWGSSEHQQQQYASEQLSRKSSSQNQQQLQKQVSISSSSEFSHGNTAAAAPASTASSTSSPRKMKASENLTQDKRRFAAAGAMATPPRESSLSAATRVKTASPMKNNVKVLELARTTSSPSSSMGTTTTTAMMAMANAQKSQNGHEVRVPGGPGAGMEAEVEVETLTDTGAAMMSMTTSSTQTHAPPSQTRFPLAARLFRRVENNYHPAGKSFGNAVAAATGRSASVVAQASSSSPRTATVVDDSLLDARRATPSSKFTTNTRATATTATATDDFHPVRRPGTAGSLDSVPRHVSTRRPRPVSANLTGVGVGVGGTGSPSKVFQTLGLDGATDFIAPSTLLLSTDMALAPAQDDDKNNNRGSSSNNAEVGVAEPAERGAREGRRWMLGMSLGTRIGRASVGSGSVVASAGGGGSGTNAGTPTNNAFGNMVGGGAAGTQSASSNGTGAGGSGSSGGRAASLRIGNGFRRRRDRGSVA